MSDEQTERRCKLHSWDTDDVCTECGKSMAEEQATDRLSDGGPK